METKNLAAGKRILIVDDEPDILDTLADLLSESTVIRASRFEAAKELLENEQFDLAILDIMGVDGYKLLEIAGQQNIIALMLTAHAMSPEDTVKSFKKGAAYFVPKDEMANIKTYLNDILEAHQKKKNPWLRWLERFSPYYNQRFGSDWQNMDKEFWEKYIEKYSNW
ncbi:MAG: response regulator [Desulfatiglandaceae bacterium]|jgi:DNA-binding response OmpR family regulator